jgi:suppressor of ftsI
MPIRFTLPLTAVVYLALGLCGLVSAANEEPAFEPLHELPELVSKDGVLSATLEARPQKVRLGSVTVNGLTYNGEYAGPMLRIHPGDVMRLTLVNHLDEPTNLHFHGIHASPQGHGDNVHIKVGPGETFHYEVPVPVQQPPGLYWYHAHLHGMAERQVMGGLSGALLVEGFREQFPALAGIKERVLVLKDYSFEESKDPIVAKEYHKLIQTINGRTNSLIAMQPGETQLWHISNQSADYFFHLSLKGHTFRIIGGDGVSANSETVSDSLDLKPAERMEVLVDAGALGAYDLLAEKTPTGSGVRYTLNRVLGKVVVAGKPQTPVATLPAFPQRENLALAKINASRVVVLSQDARAENYFLDGKKYDEDRMDIQVPLGNIEEWTLRNDSDDLHVFHIHQLHFQVTEVNGVPQRFNGYVDNAKVPERGEMKIRIPFTDSRIVGRFVYHCHVLEHEDKGMMANIEVYDPKESKLKRLWSEMGYCCAGRFSVGCMWANIRLLVSDLGR